LGGSISYRYRGKNASQSKPIKNTQAKTPDGFFVQVWEPSGWISGDIQITPTMRFSGDQNVLRYNCPENQADGFCIAMTMGGII
jgi:hypothetical protein